MAGTRQLMWRGYVVGWVSTVHALLINTFMWIDQIIQICHCKNPLADALKLRVLNLMLFMVEGSHYKRKWNFLRNSVFSLGGGRVPAPKGPHPAQSAGSWWVLPKWKTEGACENSPQLQVLGGGSAKCAAECSPSPALLEITTEPPCLLHKNLPGGFLPKVTLCHTYNMVYFLVRKWKVTLQSKNGSTAASLLVMRLCFFDSACSLKAWTPSVLLLQQGAPCFFGGESVALSPGKCWVVTHQWVCGVPHKFSEHGGVSWGTTKAEFSRTWFLITFFFSPRKHNSFGFLKLMVSQRYSWDSTCAHLCNFMLFYFCVPCLQTPFLGAGIGEAAPCCSVLGERGLCCAVPAPRERANLSEDQLRFWLTKPTLLFPQSCCDISVIFYAKWDSVQRSNSTDWRNTDFYKN